MVTADGREQIKKDTQDALTIKDAIVQIITTDRANLLDFFKENGKFYNTLQGVREQIASNPELREALNNPNLNEAQKSVLIQEITKSIMVNLGYLPNEIKMIYTDEKGQGGAEVKGFYSLENKYSYINLKNNNTLKDLVATTGTEAQRAMDTIGGIDITKNRDDNSIYALNFGESLSRYYGYALGDTTTYANAKINNPVNINLGFYNKNNREFAKLDKNLGANRVEAYSRSVGFGKNHMFIVVDGSNYKEGITIASLGAKDFIFGGDTEIVVKDINHISKEEKVAYKDRDRYLNNEWKEKQVIEIPEGMTEREFDERVLENARNYNKMFENNRYPNIVSTISESFFGGYNNNEDSLLRNSNTFVDDVIEFSGGSIMNFKNTPLQNSTELKNITEQLNKIAPHTIDFGVFMQ